MHNVGFKEMATFEQVLEVTTILCELNCPLMCAKSETYIALVHSFIYDPSGKAQRLVILPNKILNLHLTEGLLKLMKMDNCEIFCICICSFCP